MLDGGDIEQELGEVVVGDAGDGRRHRVRARSRSATRTPSCSAIPAQIGAIGPLLETHPRFPDRTNVQVARIDGPGEVTARVWERGVGETLSSGTSAVAVAAATHGDGEVVVHFPGGDLRVRLDDGPRDPLRHRRARRLSHACASSTSRPSGSRRYAERPHG